MSQCNYYDVLCLDCGASQRDIRRAYRRLVRDYHPDLHPENEDAAERMKRINEAYEVLSDPERQAAYDRELHTARNVRVRVERPEPPAAAPRARPYPSESPYGYRRAATPRPSSHMTRSRVRSIVDEAEGEFEDELERIQRILERFLYG
ncbi:MAG: J domain-containing protein [Chloroflexota bacterium]